MLYKSKSKLNSTKNQTNMRSFGSIAKSLHWTVAILVYYQLGSGIWMSRAIHDSELRAIAWRTYQNHKSVGLTILCLMIIRILWRLKHPPPDHSKWLRAWEVIAARINHWSLYAMLLINPLLGWLMVSSSPLQLPTVVFSSFTWPHVPGVTDTPWSTWVYSWSKSSHQVTGWLLLTMIIIHVIAALKHHFIDKNGILISMLPFIHNKSRPS